MKIGTRFARDIFQAMQGTLRHTVYNFLLYSEAKFLDCRRVRGMFEAAYVFYAGGAWKFGSKSLSEFSRGKHLSEALSFP